MKKFNEYRKDINNKLPTWKKHMIGNGNGNGLLFKIAISGCFFTKYLIVLFSLFSQHAFST